MDTGSCCGNLCMASRTHALTPLPSHSSRSACRKYVRRPLSSACLLHLDDCQRRGSSGAGGVRSSIAGSAEVDGYVRGDGRRRPRPGDLRPHRFVSWRSNPGTQWMSDT
eukprot:scaffold1188_cov255-Pinguiococcus_pyrenoidosus.AAC.15